MKIQDAIPAIAIVSIVAGTILGCILGPQLWKQVSGSPQTVVVQPVQRVPAVPPVQPIVVTPIVVTQPRVEQPRVEQPPVAPIVQKEVESPVAQQPAFVPLKTNTTYFRDHSVMLEWVVVICLPFVMTGTILVRANNFAASGQFTGYSTVSIPTGQNGLNLSGLWLLIFLVGWCGCYYWFGHVYLKPPVDGFWRAFGSLLDSFVDIFKTGPA